MLKCSRFFSMSKNVISFRGLLVFFSSGTLRRLIVNSCLLWQKGSRYTNNAHAHHILFWQKWFSKKFSEPLYSWFNFNRKNLQILNEHLPAKLLRFTNALSQYWDKSYSFHHLLSLSRIQLITVFLLVILFYFSNDVQVPI